MPLAEALSGSTTDPIETPISLQRSIA